MHGFLLGEPRAVMLPRAGVEGIPLEMVPHRAGSAAGDRRLLRFQAFLCANDWESRARRSRAGYADRVIIERGRERRDPGIAAPDGDAG